VGGNNHKETGTRGGQGSVKGLFGASGGQGANSIKKKKNNSRGGERSQKTHFPRPKKGKCGVGVGEGGNNWGAEPKLKTLPL